MHVWLRILSLTPPSPDGRGTILLMACLVPPLPQGGEAERTQMSVDICAAERARCGSRAPVGTRRGVENDLYRAFYRNRARTRAGARNSFSAFGVTPRSQPTGSSMLCSLKRASPAQAASRSGCRRRADNRNPWSAPTSRDPCRSPACWSRAAPRRGLSGVRCSRITRARIASWFVLRSARSHVGQIAYEFDVQQAQEVINLSQCRDPCSCARRARCAVRSHRRGKPKIASTSGREAGCTSERA